MNQIMYNNPMQQKLTITPRFIELAKQRVQPTLPKWAIAQEQLTLKAGLPVFVFHFRDPMFALRFVTLEEHLLKMVYHPFDSAPIPLADVPAELFGQAYAYYNQAVNPVTPNYTIEEAAETLPEYLFPQDIQQGSRVWAAVVRCWTPRLITTLLDTYLQIPLDPCRDILPYVRAAGEKIKRENTK
jgi:hypothetical protein